MKIIANIELKDGRYPDTGTPEEKTEVLKSLLSQVFAATGAFGADSIDRRVEIKAADGTSAGTVEFLRA